MACPELLVLAGGFGTRLRVAVPGVPKPLAPVLGRPYLHYLIECWVQQGVESLTFLLHHQAGLIEDYLESARRAGPLRDCRVRALTEPQPLGTGGAIAFAVREHRMAGSFLVANADTWLGSGIAEAAATAAPALAIIEVDDPGRYGSVHTENNIVTAFEEKRHGSGAASINAGLYHLEAAEFAGWDGMPFSLESQVFPRLVGARRLRAVPLRTEFIDIGIPEDYLRFCRWIESGKAGRP